MIWPAQGTASVEKRFWNDRALRMRHVYFSWGMGGRCLVTYSTVHIPPREDTGVLRFDMKKRPPPKWEFRQLSTDTGPAGWQWGFFRRYGPGRTHFYESNTTGIGTHWAVGFRIWPVALLSGVATGLGVRAVLHLCRRAEEARCGVCGYDLRATPTRCPECGMVPGK
jgi:hypothetical protein